MRNTAVVVCIGAALMMQGALSRAEEAASDSPAVQNVLDARVTIRVKAAPIATFLDEISRQAKVNFIITEGIESKQVTAFLQNVTAREALQILLEIKGLTCQRIGKSNTYVVSPRSKFLPGLVTRIYALANVDLESCGGDAAPVFLAAKSVLSKEGKAVADTWTNSIVVTDFPEIFSQVEQVIGELDKPARKPKAK